MFISIKRFGLQRAMCWAVLLALPWGCSDETRNQDENGGKKQSTVWDYSMSADRGFFVGRSAFERTLLLHGVSPNVTRRDHRNATIEQEKLLNVLVGHVRHHNLSYSPPKATIEFDPDGQGKRYKASVTLKDIRMRGGLDTADAVLMLTLGFDEFGQTGKPAVWNSSGEQVDLPYSAQTLDFRVHAVNGDDEILPNYITYMKHCPFGSFKSRTELCIGIWNLTMFRGNVDYMKEVGVKFDPYAGGYPLSAEIKIGDGVLHCGFNSMDPYLPQGGAAVAVLHSKGVEDWGGDTRINVTVPIYAYPFPLSQEPGEIAAYLHVNWDPDDNSDCSNDEYTSSCCGCLLDPDKYSCTGIPPYSCQILSTATWMHDPEPAWLSDLLGAIIDALASAEGKSSHDAVENAQAYANAIETLFADTLGTIYIGIFKGPIAGMECTTEQDCYYGGSEGSSIGYDCVDGKCFCDPICSNVACGADGCGGTCPNTCDAGQVCIEGKCCTPDCQGKCSGQLDGCNGTCTCRYPNQVCNQVTNTCVCDPPGDWCFQSELVSWDGTKLCAKLPAGKVECKAGCSVFTWGGSGGDLRLDCTDCNPPGNWCFFSEFHSYNEATKTLCVTFGEAAEPICATCPNPDGCCFVSFGKTLVTDGLEACLDGCVGKECGTNFWGKSCGVCPEGQVCISAGLTSYETPLGGGVETDKMFCCGASCEGKNCGPDGCGGTCGSCEGNQVCANGRCCSPYCPEGRCGSDQCGGICTNCVAPSYCSKDGQCVTGNCTETGAVCGPDGVGGSCGKCYQGKCEYGLCADS